MMIEERPLVEATNMVTEEKMAVPAEVVIKPTKVRTSMSMKLRSLTEV